MRQELMKAAEAELNTLEAGIALAAAAVCRLSALEDDALNAGASSASVADIKKSLDQVAKEIRQLRRAKKVLHEKISQAGPQTPEGPVVFIGT